MNKPQDVLSTDDTVLPTRVSHPWWSSSFIIGAI